MNFQEPTTMLNACTKKSGNLLKAPRTSNIHKSNKRQWFHILKKGKKQQYIAKTLTDADYADDQVILANTLAQAESLLQSLEHAVGVIGICANAI